MKTATAALPPITERDFTSQVVGLARQLGYLTFHTFLSIRSAPGFPDLVLVRPGTEQRAGRTIYVELKNEKGKVSAHQAVWLGALKLAGNEVYLWRPSELQELAEILASEYRPHQGSAKLWDERLAAVVGCR